MSLANHPLSRNVRGGDWNILTNKQHENPSIASPALGVWGGSWTF